MLKFSKIPLSALAAAIFAYASPATAGPTPECAAGSGANSTECGVGSTTSGNGATAVGAQSSAGPIATAMGNEAAASGFASIAIGATSEATHDFSAAIGVGAEAHANGSVAIGNNSVADVDNTVSVGNAGLKRRIVNVAAGAVDASSTDAVNGSQLHATNQALIGQATLITALQTSDSAQNTAVANLQTSDTAQNATLATHNSQIGQLDARVTTLEAMAGNVGGLQNSVSELFDLRKSDRRDMKQGIAAAVAMADAPMPSRPGGISYQVKTAIFRGEHAFSGALSYRLNTASPMAVSAGVSFAGSKNNAASVAVSGEF